MILPPAYLSELFPLLLPLYAIVVLECAQQEIDLGDCDFGDGIRAPCRAVCAWTRAGTESAMVRTVR
jgi:hypothetical protein